MKLICIVLFELIIISNLWSQLPVNQHADAEPAVGWDSLKSLIRYPEIARRAGVQGHATIKLQLDSSGNVTKLSVCAPDLFTGMIEQTIKGLKWLPGFSLGKPRPTTMLEF